jgi:hypothetical protein
MLCIIVVFAAGFFAVFLAFVLNTVDNIKQDPEAMAELRGRKKKLPMLFPGVPSVLLRTILAL